MAVLGLTLFTLTIGGPQAYAETLGEMRARYINESGVAPKWRPAIAVVAPKQWIGISRFVESSLLAAHRDLENLLGRLEQPEVLVRLLDENEFFVRTRAPLWTNALYYKGEILIPIKSGANINTEELRKTVRHEYSHAVIGKLTNNQTPGWFDEGLAQMIEGPVNPLLVDALNSWLSEHNSPLPIEKLARGFTKMDENEVPAAYAQSLILVIALKKAYGGNGLRAYLDRIKTNSEAKEAALLSFNMAPRELESLIVKTMQELKR